MSKKSWIILSIILFISIIFTVILGVFFEKSDESIDAEIHGQKIIFSLEDGEVVSTPFDFKPKFKPIAKLDKKTIDVKPGQDKIGQTPEEKPEPLQNKKIVVSSDNKVKPEIIVIVRNLGLNDEATMLAIDKLPEEVVIGLSPYGDNVDYYAVKAMRKGHNILLNLPMQTSDYPVDDPGPHALLNELSIEKNSKRLEWVFGHTKNMIGFYVDQKANFLKFQQNIEFLISELKDKKLLLVNDGSNKILKDIATKHKVRIYENYNYIESDMSESKIRKKFNILKETAINNGTTILSIGPYPYLISIFEKILNEHKNSSSKVKLISINN